MYGKIQTHVPRPSRHSSRLRLESIFFVGTATVILRYAVFTIVTDPNFLHAGDHTHLGYALKSEWLTAPAIDIERLPPPPRFESGSPSPWKRTERTCSSRRRRPGRRGPHAAAKRLCTVMRTARSAFKHRTVSLPYPYTFSGDTLVFDDLKEIPIRYPNIDQGLFHLGGTRIMGIRVMMGAKQGVAAIRIVNPHEAIRSTTTITGFSNHRSKTSREPSPLRVSTTG